MNLTHQSKQLAWGNFRFSVIGGLLASPPPKGNLGNELKKLAEKTWQHPINKEPVKFTYPTIEQWYYQAKAAKNPTEILRRKTRDDNGRFKILTPAMKNAIAKLHSKYPGWTHKLHHENLIVVAKDANLGKVPSYATIRRYRKSCGFLKVRKPKNTENRPGMIKALSRLEAREVRSYEASHVMGLIHSDFHECSRKILNEKGEWAKPHLVAFMDDHSRLICHAQWYWRETAENFVHGLTQAILKRGLPRALMTDNGSAMKAGETQRGLRDLSIIQEFTLPYSPYQNGKQESFWGKVEGRLIAMLEGEKDLTLKKLNEATIAWIEMDYHRKVHSETKQTPIDRFLNGPSVDRRSPSPQDLKEAFTIEESRSLRRSDCTVSIEGTRYEVPSRYRHLNRIAVRYAIWDLSNIRMVNKETGKTVCSIYPVDSEKNADSRRRKLTPVDRHTEDSKLATSMAPLLKEMIQSYNESGLPSAYIPKDENDGGDDK